MGEGGLGGGHHDGTSPRTDGRAGNLFIYQLQRDYGALVVTTATTVRKFLSVLASSLPKEGVCAYLPLLPQGLCGLAALPGCGILSGPREGV